MNKLVSTDLCYFLLPQEMELHEAVYYGITKKVQLLLEQNVPVNSVDKVYIYNIYVV